MIFWHTLKCFVPDTSVYFTFIILVAPSGECNHSTTSSIKISRN